MIPDVPKSLREQLKRENMMLMEFLLNQDQECFAKPRSPKQSSPCFPTYIDIVVEAPPEEEQQQVQEEEDEEVDFNLDILTRTSDSDPEIGMLVEDVQENGGEVPGEVGEEEEREKEIDGAVNDEGEGGNNEQEGGEEKEEELRKEEENEAEEKADEKDNFTVNLDSFMSDMGPLGERRTPSSCLYL